MIKAGTELFVVVFTVCIEDFEVIFEFIVYLALKLKCEIIVKALLT